MAKTVSLKLTLHKMKQKGIERAEPAVGNGTVTSSLGALENASDLHDGRTRLELFELQENDETRCEA